MSDESITTTCKAVVRPLLDWFAANARSMPWRDDPTPYHVWLSEVMLQQTRVEAVRGYYDRFLTALPDIASLAAAPEEALLKLWQGLGYYNRVRNLQKAAQLVCEQYGGVLPADFALLRALPGFGDYTAGAVASIAFGIPVTAVDGNVLRVISRIMGYEGDIALPATKKQITAWVEQMLPHDLPGTFNQALMELGATVCLPNGAPLCEKCPVSAQCTAYQQGKTEILPVKSAKKARRIEEKTVLVLRCGSAYAIAKRPDKGLLARLWEFPSLAGRVDADAVADAVREMGLEPLSVTPLTRAKHIFTHIEWHMTGFAVRVDCRGGGFTWATAEELTHAYSIPTAFAAYVPGQ